MKNFRVGVFAGRAVGEGAIKFLIENYRDDLICIAVTENDSSITQYLRDNGFDS